MRRMEEEKEGAGWMDEGSGRRKVNRMMMRRRRSVLNVPVGPDCLQKGGQQLVGQPWRSNEQPNREPTR